MSMREAFSIGIKFFFVGLILFSAFWASADAGRAEGQRPEAEAAP